ncbi:YkgJ family cysteine cluster protein [Paraburkholderia sp. BL21I4N1]|uniref:YkgJ family cysteine cluster protein n=1 Tax=Paraburkholderia sp. BL21I4N1 TaxID=1938801 RepID=UPI000D4E6D4B|nr:YkgJ family cysteine cluster protein [Paraburkholderia sp. BL21I4N1]PQV49299.1 putative zinc- or iron-chelating protein [Paraburkholderia sp. BL21I4N1]
MDDINFECTACGKCCHDLRLPLTLAEATAWLARGGQMELLCEAIPWPVEPEADNEQAAYKKARSAATMSGSLPVRVSVLLVAAFAGACPNLGSDMRCRIYEERPLVCRIYPAEINPFVALAPESKACPPDAWQHTPLQRHGVLVDETTRELIGESRRTSELEAALRVQLCLALGLNEAALANEGFVIYAPDSDALRAALQQVRATPANETLAAATPWTFVSNRAVTVETLLSVGAAGRLNEPTADAHFRYHGYFPAEPA